MILRQPESHMISGMLEESRYELSEAAFTIRHMNALLCVADRDEWRWESDRGTRAAALGGDLQNRWWALHLACAAPKAGALTKLRYVP